MRPDSDTEEFRPLKLSQPVKPEVPVVKVTVEAAANTNAGKVRSNNEDHYLVTRVERSLAIAALYKTLASRVILQVDQAASAYQAVYRQQRECG